MEAVYDLRFVLVALKEVMQALPVTLVLTLVPLAAGLVFGVPIAIIRRFQNPYAAAFFRNTALVLKGVPSVLLVLLMNYLFLKPIDLLARNWEWIRPLHTMNKIYIGILALSIYGIVQITETVISALRTVDNGQYEAAYAVGLTKRQTLIRIVFPQMIPAALPMLGNNMIGLLKTTSVVYLISVNDILNTAMNSANINFRYLEAYIAVAIAYWGMCILIEQLFAVLERQYKKAAGGAI